jgi:hypothetical protein
MAGSGRNRNDSVTKPEKQRQKHGISVTKATNGRKLPQIDRFSIAQLPSLQSYGSFAPKETP